MQWSSLYLRWSVPLTKSKLGLRPFAFGDDGHDSGADFAGRLLELLVRWAVLVVEIVVAVVFED